MANKKSNPSKTKVVINECLIFAKGDHSTDVNKCPIIFKGQGNDSEFTLNHLITDIQTKEEENLFVHMENGQLYVELTQYVLIPKSLCTKEQFEEIQKILNG